MRETRQRAGRVRTAARRSWEPPVAGNVRPRSRGGARRPRSVLESLVEQPRKRALGSRVCGVAGFGQAAERERRLERAHRVALVAEMAALVAWERPRSVVALELE